MYCSLLYSLKFIFKTQVQRSREEQLIQKNNPYVKIERSNNHNNNIDRTLQMRTCTLHLEIRSVMCIGAEENYAHRCDPYGLRVQEQPLFLQTRLLIDLNHCGYIFLLDSSAQDTNSFSFLLTKHGQGNGSVLKNKNQNKPKNDALNSNCGGKASNA